MHAFDRTGEMHSIGCRPVAKDGPVILRCNGFGHIPVEKDGAFGVLSSDGNTVLAPEYDEISFGIEDILVKKTGGWRYFMPGRGIFLPGEYEEAEHFLGTHARVKKDGVWGLTDQHGYFREGSWTDYGARPVAQLNEGMTLMEHEGRLGIADKNGNLVTPCIFEDVGICRDNAIAVKFADSWGFVDRHGKLIVNCCWDKVTPFRKGFARVYRNGRRYEISKDGTTYITGRTP